MQHVMIKVIVKFTLASVARLVGALSHTSKVSDSIPGAGMCLDCRFDHHSGHIQEATDHCFSLTLMFLSTSFSQINKHIYLIFL